MFGYGKAYDDSSSNMTSSKADIYSDSATYATNPSNRAYDQQNVRSFNSSNSYNSYRSNNNNNHKQTKSKPSRAANTNARTGSGFGTSATYSSRREASQRSAADLRRAQTSSSFTDASAARRRAEHRRKQLEKRRSQGLERAYTSSNFENNIRDESGRSKYSGMTQEQMIARRDELKESNLDSLDRALGVAYQTEEVAGDTMDKLHHQGQQLKRIDKNLHETDQTLDQTQHMLKGMKSIFGAVGNWFKKAPKYNRYEQERRANSGRDANEKEVGNGSNSGAQQSQMAQEDNNDEENARLDELLKSVKNLNTMAKVINEELDDQAQMIDKIDERMDVVDEKMKNQSHTMRRIH